MANKEAVFTLKVNTGNSANDIKATDKALNDFNKDLKATQQTASSGTGMDALEKNLADLDAKMKAGGLSMREMTKTMKEYQNIAIQAGVETPIGSQALKNASSLKDEIGDLKAQTKALSSDFKGLDTAMAGISTGASVFQGMQSAMALAGVENEALVQTMVKLQAVQGLVNAVQTIANNLNSDSILGIQLRTALTVKDGESAVASITARTIAEKSYQMVVGTSTGLMKGLKLAIASTGIGLLIVALGLVVAYWDDIKSAVSGVTSGMKDQLAITTARAEQSKKEVDNFQYQENSLKLQGKSEEQILKIRMEKQRVALKDAKAQLEAQIAIQQGSEKASIRNFNLTKQILKAIGTVGNLIPLGIAYAIDGISAGIISLMKMANNFTQKFQGLMIGLLVAPIDIALKGANEISKALGLGSINAKSIMSDITEVAKSTTKAVNETIQGLKGTNLAGALNSSISGIADWGAGLIFDTDEIKKDGEKGIQELQSTVDQMQSELDGGELQIREIKKKSAEDQKKIAEDSAKSEAERRKAQLSVIKSSVEEEGKILEELENTKLKNLEEGSAKQIAILEEQFGDWRTQLIQTANKEEIDALDQKFLTQKMSEEEYRKQLEEIMVNGVNNLTDKEKELMAQKMAELETEKTQIVLDANAKRELKRAELLGQYFNTVASEYDKELKAFEDQQKKQIQALNEAHQEGLISDKEYLKAQEKLETDYANKIVEINKKKNDKITEANKKKFQEDTEGLTKGIETAQQVVDKLGEINNIAKQYEENKLASIQASRETDLADLDAKQKAELENTNLTEEQRNQITQKYAIAKYQIQLKAFNEEEKIKKAQFNRDKALRIAQATIDTASAIVKSIADNGGVPLGIPFGVLAGAMGLAQIGAIASTQYKGGSAPSMPSLSGGGGGGGMAGAGASSFSAQPPTNAGTSTEGLLGNAVNQAPVSQVFVLESDISQTQSKVKLQETKTSW